MAQLNFKGKSLVQNHHLTVKFHELEPVKAKSLTKRVALDDNLIIHGDNLKALKSLLPTHAGRIKCVYIDPPYNTGNEGWAYNDNVNHPMITDWLGKVVDKDDLTRHDKWLCMMLPRLQLLRELLSEDGAIFVSIDDNEQHRLRMLMDEVFGEENFVTSITWQKRYTRSNNTDNFTTVVEQIIVYSKSIEFKPHLFERENDADERYTNPDNDPRGPWKLIPFLNPLSPEDRPNLVYPILNPIIGSLIMPKKKAWRSSKAVFEQLLKDKRVYWGKDGKSSTPGIKRFLSEVRGGMTPINFWSYEFAGHTDEANNEFKEIFGKKIFETLKPVKLVKRIINVCADKDSIILDAFAGSGTTGHAALALNKQDGGNRKFILIESEDYADKITAERIRRVIKGVKTAKDENLKKGLGGSFSYFELGEPLDIDRLLSGKNLPKYEDLARYVFFTATGEEFDTKKINSKTGFIGESKEYEVYLFYKPDVEYLKKTALDLAAADALGKPKKKKRLVFAPTKYLDQEMLDARRIEFAQLPFEIYRRAS